jgi:hypothetical protein
MFAALARSLGRLASSAAFAILAFNFNATRIAGPLPAMHRAGRARADREGGGSSANQAAACGRAHSPLSIAAFHTSGRQKRSRHFRKLKIESLCQNF